MNDKHTVGELFAGIGGIGLGLERTGCFEVKWQVECDKYANKVLAKNWPDVRRHDDVCTFPPKGNWKVDVVAGGFPCTDISNAGEREGIHGKQSGLFFEAMRVIETLQPKWVVLENVTALLIRGMGDVLKELAKIGFDAEWHCIPAASVGAPHIRDRVFVLANNRNGGGEAAFHTNPMCQRLQRRATQQVQGVKDLQRQLERIRENIGKQQWALAPGMGRMVAGFPGRVDRIKCLGNAVVPQVSQFVGELLLQRIQEQQT